MAKDLKRQRLRILHEGGGMTLNRGLAEYLGIESRSPNLGRTPAGNRRHARGGSAVAGVPYALTLDDGSVWGVRVTGSLKAFETAYFLSRPAPKMAQAVSPGLTILRPRVGA